MEHLFEEIELSTISVKAKLSNYEFSSENVIWDAPEVGPIKQIDSDIYCSRQPGFKPQVKTKKSNRGRKPKKKVKKSKVEFGSNIIFVVMHEVSRKVKKVRDKYSDNAIPDMSREGYEIIFKEFNVKIFNKGSVICVGVRKEDKSDFAYIMKHVLEYINTKSTKPVEIYDIESTMQNYQTNLKNSKLICLSKFQRLLINEYIPSLICVNFNEMAKYMVSMYKDKKMLIDSEQMLMRMKYNDTRETTYIEKDVFHKYFHCKSLGKYFKIIDQKCDEYYESFDRIVDEEFRQKFAEIYLKEFVIPNYAKKISENGAPSNIRYNGNQTALLLYFNSPVSDITTKIFGSGSIGIYGSKSMAQTKKIINNIGKIIQRYENTILYYEDYPPIDPMYDHYI